LNAFIEVSEHDEQRIAVKGREYCAGSNHEEMPPSIPMANGIALTPRQANATPAEAAQLCRVEIDARLPATGSVLFRSLPLRNREDFNGFVNALGYPNHSYHGGIAVRPRSAGASLPASNEDERISMAPHNEMAYLPNFPKKIFFFCETAAAQGGEVPINDIRKSVEHIPDSVLNRFAATGILYRRYLPKVSSAIEIGWQETFGLSSADTIEAAMKAKGYDFGWHDDEGLSYSYVHSAFIDDPRGGRPLWFNQVTELHASYWRNHPLFPSNRGDSRYPATTAYGDGEPIDTGLVSTLRAALWKTARAVALKPGDVLVLDNTYIQHGRFAYSGIRSHFVSMTA